MTAHVVDVEQGAVWPPLDTSQNQIVLAVGKKGFGKSDAVRVLHGWWPDVDKLTIDVNGDADPGADAQKLTDPLPSKMPERTDKDRPLNLHYIANPKSATYRDDLDRAVGLALFPKERRTLLWIDEIGEVTQTNKTPPNLRLLLQQSRHYHASALMCGPRPVMIDRLCVAQADRILMFFTPLKDDREYIADHAGIDRRLLEAAHDEVRRRGKFWHLMYIADEPEELYLCPPMPAEWRDITPA